MALTFTIRLRDGCYDAAAEDPRLGEWPPHPARLFCALVASAVDEADLNALRWLERAGRPQVWACRRRDVTMATRGGFVPTNSVEPRGGSQTRPARTNKFRSRAAACPRGDEFTVVWRDADPDDLTLARLVRLAAKVPYLGRSTGSADVTVAVSDTLPREGWTTFEPVTYDQPAHGEWRLPYDGYVDALRHAYESGRRAWEVGRLTPFREGPPEEPDPGPLPSPYDLMVWALKPPVVAPDGSLFLQHTVAMRRAVFERVADPLPPLLSGHGVDGQPHVAFLGLVDIDHEHADGRLLGLALALPRVLDRRDRRKVLQGLLDEASPFTQLKVRRTHTVELARELPRPRYAQRPERWTGVMSGGAATWVTATPVMLDRFLKRDSDVEEAVANCLVTAGYPAPASVEVDRSPFVKGGISRFRWPEEVRSRPRRPIYHARVRFDRPVHGPVIAGSMRYLGLGLFAPAGVRP